MSDPSIRRAQLIAPFGVGALYTDEKGRSIIAAGLDHWFETMNPERDSVDPTEFLVDDEWRLEQLLRVSHFRLPPDHRTAVPGHQANQPNLNLTVPFLTFPLWHVCPHCRVLTQFKYADGSRRRCARCDSDQKKQGPASGKKGTKYRAPYLVPVRFIAICEEGHLQDFPWRDWVHRTSGSTCEKPMRLVARGGESLASQQVECACGVSPRNLSGVTSTSGEVNFKGRSVEDSVLSQTLLGDARYECAGSRPWLAEAHGNGGCGAPLRGSLRSALNVYYPHVASAIYVPRVSGGFSSELMDVLKTPAIRTQVKLLIDIEHPVTARFLIDRDDIGMLGPYSEEEIDHALVALVEELTLGKKAQEGSSELGDLEDIRSFEYERIRQSSDEKDFKIRQVPNSNYSGWLQDHFDRVNLLDEIRETRVLYGFSRIRPETKKTISELKDMMWRRAPQFAKSWLPAYIVRGEGIYLELNSERVRRWESRDQVSERLDVLVRNYDEAKAKRGLADHALLPRFVLLHTLAHLVLNQLTFECGYSSASLRERLFCGVGEKPMAGLMIYTAAGDSEGTMGGLVRMGRSGVLDRVIKEALERARWCSSDPICMELGAHGQGPDSCNLAACHSCALVPETSCESFNKFLDRAMLIGTPDSPDVGFFTGL